MLGIKDWSNSEREKAKWITNLKKQLKESRSSQNLSQQTKGVKRLGKILIVSSWTGTSPQCK